MELPLARICNRNKIVVSLTNPLVNLEDQMHWKEWRTLTGIRTKEVAKASFLQSEVRRREREGDEQYEQEWINRSIVHTREDIVLVASRLEGIHVASNQVVRRLNAVVVIGIVFLGIYLL